MGTLPISLRAAGQRSAQWWLAVAEIERGRFPLWLPVLMACGAALYFALRAEPPPWAGLAILLPAMLAAGLGRTFPRARAIALIIAAAALGFSAAQFAAFTAAPLEPLPTRAVTVSGTVAMVELLPENALRVTLTQPRLHPDTPPLRRDLRIRLRPNDPIRPEAGDLISVRALLRAPASALFPGAWDTQRDAFFTGLAGTGTALNAAERLTRADPPARAISRFVQRARETIARRFADGMEGAEGAIGSALFTGFMAAIPRPDQSAFRDSGLAHLLSVSGLHVAIVIGLVFGLTRAALALSQYAALHWPCKQIAALAGLAAALAYTPLAGAQVPLLRSVAMAALVVLGILAGRRALTLRGLSLAAGAVLLVAPQELVGPSAQMSFSAVLALIAGHDALRPLILRWRVDAGWMRRAAISIFLLSMTSLLAGSASAPFGIYHFGRVQVYFILANLLAVPLAGLWIMPWGLCALALMPFGLEFLAFAPMSWGIQATLWIAHTIATLPAATFDIPHMPLWGLVAYTAGLLWLGIWHGRWRLLGFAPILLGLSSPAWHHRADILISADARLIAARIDGHTYLRQEGNVAPFPRDAFARYWADRAPIGLPANVPGRVNCAGILCRLRPHPDAPEILLVMRGDHVPPEACAGAALVLAAVPLRGTCPGLPAIDRFTVWRDGAFAVRMDPAGARLLSDRQDRGTRPWVQIPPRRRSELPPAITE